MFFVWISEDLTVKHCNVPWKWRKHNNVYKPIHQIPASPDPRPFCDETYLLSLFMLNRCHFQITTFCTIIKTALQSSQQQPVQKQRDNITKRSPTDFLQRKTRKIVHFQRVPQQSRREIQAWHNQESEAKINSLASRDSFKRESHFNETPVNNYFCTFFFAASLLHFIFSANL